MRSANLHQSAGDSEAQPGSTALSRAVCVDEAALVLCWKLWPGSHAPVDSHIFTLGNWTEASLHDLCCS